MANTEDDGTCWATLLAIGLLGVLAMAPYLSLQAIDGDVGAVGTLLGVAFLALTAVAPFIPMWGIAVGVQWTLYVLWLGGYFSVVTDWTEAITEVADPNDGLDGFVLALLMLPVVLVVGLVLYLAVPAAVGLAGGALFNLPGILASRAKELDPWQNWTTPQPEAAGSAEPFRMPRWRTPHNNRGDASLRRRRNLIAAALIGYGLTIPAALVVVFGPIQPRAAQYVWFVVVWAAAAAVALIQWSVARSVQRDLTAWRLPDDRHAHEHRDTVALANEWAASVHPDDLRDGRPVVESLLRESEEAMNRAQRLEPIAARQSEAAGAGWTPPSVHELADAEESLRTLKERMSEVRRAGLSYAQARELADARQQQERLLRGADEELAVLDAATQTYWQTYAALFDRLASSGADGGLPDPQQFRRNRHVPPNLRAAELPATLVRMLDRAEDLLRQARDAGATATELAGRWAEFDHKSQSLQGLADLALAAGVRLSLSGEPAAGDVPLDDRGVRDLIRSIQARIQAEEEIERHWL